jgi:hypothetical protein
MSNFDDSLVAMAESVHASLGGESITYTPAGGAPVPITALVIRGVLSPVSELGGKVGALHHELVVLRTAIATISKGDSFTFADTKGGAVSGHHDIEIDRSRTDAGAWTLKAR